MLPSMFLRTRLGIFQVILPRLCSTLHVGPGRSCKANIQEAVPARHSCLQVLALDRISQRCCDLLPNRRVPGLDGVKAISPTQYAAGLTRRALHKPRPPIEKGNPATSQEVSVTTQQSAEAPSHGIVMFNREILRTLRRNRSEQIICPRTRAEQHQPCTLQIGDCSGRLFLEESPHALRMPQRGAKHFHPLLGRREFRISTPHDCVRVDLPMLL